MLSYNDITTNILYSGKAYSTSNGSNFDICSDTLTTVLEDILDYLDAYEGDCKVKTNSSDGTCGYLEDKFTSSDGSVTITPVYSNTPLTPTDYVLDLTVTNSAYTPVLYNNQYPQTSNANPDTLFSYSVPSNTLNTDGDIIEVETLIKGSSVSNGFYCNILVNSVSTTGVGNAVVNYGLGYAKVKLQISRTTATTIVYELVYTKLSESLKQLQSQYYYNGSINVSDLGANALPIILKTTGQEGQIANYFTVKYFPI